MEINNKQLNEIIYNKKINNQVECLSDFIFGAIVIDNYEKVIKTIRHKVYYRNNPENKISVVRDKIVNIYKEEIKRENNSKGYNLELSWDNLSDDQIRNNISNAIIDLDKLSESPEVIKRV